MIFFSLVKLGFSVFQPERRVEELISNALEEISVHDSFIEKETVKTFFHINLQLHSYLSTSS